MVGLGKTNEEIVDVLSDLRHHGVTMLNLGAIFNPVDITYQVKRYVSPKEFEEIRNETIAMGFTHAACGPLVRLSYHADLYAT